MRPIRWIRRGTVLPKDISEARMHGYIIIESDATIEEINRLNEVEAMLSQRYGNQSPSADGSQPKNQD